MAKNILILHGWNAGPKNNWFMKAKDEWKKKGFMVEVPQLPGNYFPKLDDWLKVIDNFSPDQTWVLIGHSLGGAAILKYLETAYEKVAQAIFIATPFEPMSFNPIANFFADGFDWAKIKSNCSKFVVLNEMDDAVVPIEHGQKLAKALGVKVTEIPGGSHFHNIDLDFLKGLILK